MNKVVRLDEYGNKWYSPGPVSKQTAWYIVSLLFIRSAIPYPVAFKAFLLRLFGAKVGKNIIMKPSITIKYPWFFEIGDHSWLGENVWIDNMAAVRIGSNACISQGVYVMTGNHDYKKETFDLIVKAVTIEEGAWVGARAVVCPGVTIGTHSVVTAGSVVTKSVEPYKICQGNPARVVRDRVIG